MNHAKTGETMSLRTCKNTECKKPFPPVTVWQRFCTSVCRERVKWLVRKAQLRLAQKMGRGR